MSFYRTRIFALLAGILVVMAGLQVTSASAQGGADKVGICHKTGSQTNPYEFIQVSQKAAPAHAKHGDVVGASSMADCPGSTPPTQCSDGLDNDGDGLIDFSSDPGCTSATDDDETDAPPPAQCSDGLDNDGDGLIDFPNDPGCTSATDDDETDPVACNTATNSGGEGVTSTVHQMGQSSGTFNFDYSAYSVPDQFDIYYESVLIYSTGGPVSGSATVPVTYSGTATEITVVVTGPAGTVWDYQVNCPA